MRAKMPSLTGRPPLGPKTGKPAKKPRKPIPKQSAKRKAYMASSARQDGLAHMGRVAEMGCFVCGARPVEVHHFPNPRSDFRTGPLCPPHHRREFGPGAYHYSPKAFRETHGSDEEIVAVVNARLAT
jgi:hypothetical protein